MEKSGISQTRGNSFMLSAETQDGLRLTWQVNPQTLELTSLFVKRKESTRLVCAIYVTYSSQLGFASRSRTETMTQQDLAALWKATQMFLETKVEEGGEIEMYSQQLKLLQVNQAILDLLEAGEMIPAQ